MDKFTLIIIFLLNSTVFGQYYFNKLIDITGPGSAEVYRGFASNFSENKFYLIGTSSASGLNNPIVVEFNEVGELKDTMWIDNSSDGLYFAPGNNNYSIVDNENNIIFVGAHGFSDNERATAIIFKINELGDTIWTREFGTVESFDAFSSIRFTKDSNYVMTGYSTRFGSFAQAWLVKMDPSGNVLWEQNYGGFGGEDAYSVDTTADGGYILAGFTDTYGAGERDIYVVKTDAEGNVEWEKWFGGEGHEVGKVKALSNGNSLVYGGWKFVHPEAVWLSVSHGHVMELDENGVIVWQRIYTNADTSSIAHFSQYDAINDCQVVNDGYIFSGGGTDTTINNPAGWVFKTDFSGNLLWSRRYKLRTNDHYLWDMEVLPGGDLLFGGFVFSSGGGVDSQDGWIMRTNCLGFNGPPILEASVNHNAETHTVTLYNHSQRFGDGSIDWGDGTTTTFTEHDTTVFTHVYTQNGEYNIQFNINACYHHDSLSFHQTVSGIPKSEPPISEFSTYPNPTNGLLTLSYNPTGETLNAGVQIFDMAGRLVYNKNMPNFYAEETLNLNALSAGTYALRFFTVVGVDIVEKLVVY